MYFHKDEKREPSSAKRREFDVHVDNIQHINNKTYGLLDLVKNGMREEKSKKKEDKKIAKQNKNIKKEAPKFDERRYQQIEKEIQSLRKKLHIKEPDNDEIDTLITKKHNDMKLISRKPICYNNPLKREKTLLQTFITDKKSEKIDENMRSSQKKEKHFQIKVYPCNFTIEMVKDQIAKQFANQLELDANYERVKNDFLLWISPNKWEDLKSKLWEKGVLFQDIQSMKEAMYLNRKVIGVGIGEWNELDELVDRYERAEQNWQRKVQKMIPKQELDRLNFNPMELDLENKGYLSRQDIACFVNLRMGKFYKGQNAQMIVERLRGSREVVSYQALKERIELK